MLEEVGILKIGNVGDCGLKLLRQGFRFLSLYNLKMLGSCFMFSL